MRRLLAALSLIATPALADDDTTSGLIAAQGLAGAVATLESAPASADRDMALAATRFLAGIEAAYHARWLIGATDPVLPLPVLGTPLPPNPEPQPMRADFINALAADLAASMQASREAIPQDDAALILRLSDLWLDVDGNGSRSDGESLPELAGLPMPEGASGEIRFDAADAHWLRAYTHLIEALSTLTLAFDPEPALARRIALDQELARQFSTPSDDAGRPPRLQVEAQMFGSYVDQIGALLQTLRNQPDKARIGAAAQHLHAMIAANRDFWTAVAAETDNDREWIPNDSQQAALGFDLPAGTADAWQTVLTDAETVLNGQRLIPFWRFAPGYGVDLAAWIADPQPVDVIGWVQGTAALPYAKAGLPVSEEGWNRFLSLFQGRAGLYMVLFN